MWQRYRPTLAASVCSCVLHLSLLGAAALIPITKPSSAREVLRVTILQRATPLPVQDVAGGPKEVPPERPQQVVTKPAPPQVVPPKPPKVKKAPPPRRRVAPKPSPKKPSKVEKEAPPVRREEPQQLATPSPPRPEPLQSPPDSARITGETPTEGQSDHAHRAARALTNGGMAVGRRRGSGDGQGSGVGNLAQPDYNVNPKPPYPLIARRLGAQGEVLLRVRVREDGSVAEVELARSSGFALLDESATRTVQEDWRFIPARLDGEPVESWVEVPIKFVLAGS